MEIVSHVPKDRNVNFMLTIFATEEIGETPSSPCLVSATPIPIKNDGALASWVYLLWRVGMLVLVIGLVMIVLSSKKFKDAKIIDKYIIHSYGFRSPGNLHEEVGITVKDAEYYYYTLSEYDRMNAGGESAKVPEKFVSGQDVDIDSLLTYIAEKHPYMESLQKHTENNS